MDIDSIDLQLLEQLQQDSSLSNQDLAARVHISPPTCLRRVKRLRESGLIEREMAVLCADKFSALAGHSLCAIVEVTLDRQDHDALEAFEKRVTQDDAVQQCYRVSPGPDFCLVVHCASMPDYQALTQRLFTTDANVRNVKTFFSIKRSKFGARLPVSTHPITPAAA
ncbi:MAG: Lrp/AsnC family transcriptional regulator [Rhodoferax sp.]|jgi:Lrp/AsnC family leucine-responsive transcriptional regulator|nr:Lrp/AsnC family transcriptional regulator [Rhodoferax sp.]MBP9686096.1 Lrp/AsnC family transcriptional regulator [Rhodoferax sp.]